MCRPYVVQDGILFYKKNMTRVILDKEERLKVLKTIHCGSDTSAEATALYSHHGRGATQELLRSRFYWPSMTNDARQFVKNCDACQKVNLLP